MELEYSLEVPQQGPTIEYPHHVCEEIRYFFLDSPYIVELSIMSLHFSVRFTLSFAA